MKLIFSLLLFLLLLPPTCKAQAYVQGKVITTKGDTLTLKILKYKSCQQEARENFVSIQVQQDSGEVHTFYPEDIAGYLKEGLFFRTFRSKTADPKFVSFFGKQLTHGRAELYYFPGDEKGVGHQYLFRKSHEKEFISWDGAVISRVEELDRHQATNQSSATGGIRLRVTENEEAVRQYFMNYFADCVLIVNKLKSRFYAEINVEGLFKEYNASKIE